jgi:hypothetical protein
VWALTLIAHDLILLARNGPQTCEDHYLHHFFGSSSATGEHGHSGDLHRFPKRHRAIPPQRETEQRHAARLVPMPSAATCDSAVDANPSLGTIAPQTSDESRGVGAVGVRLRKGTLPVKRQEKRTPNGIRD